MRGEADVNVGYSWHIDPASVEFADPEDPRSAPNGGVPWVLTTKLFSDYAVKYRVAFLPPGAQASYNDKASNGVDATLVFPVGTILAKTFAFANETTHTETPVETLGADILIGHYDELAAACAALVERKADAR